MTISQQKSILLKQYTKFTLSQSQNNLLDGYLKYNSYLLYKNILDACMNSTYISSISFIEHSDIYKLLVADKRLRMCIFNAIEEIEIALKTQLFNSFENNNIKWRRKSRKDKHIYKNYMFKINTKSNQSIYDFLNKKSEDANGNSDLISTFYFSEVVSIFKNIDNNLYPNINQIVQDLGFDNYRQAKFIFEELVYIRNQIAHHNTIIDYNVLKRIHINKNMNNSLVQYPKQIFSNYFSTTNKQLPQSSSQKLCIILYWVDRVIRTIRNNSGFYNKINHIHKEYKSNSGYNFLQNLTHVDTYLIVCK